MWSSYFSSLSWCDLHFSHTLTDFSLILNTNSPYFQYKSNEVNLKTLNFRQDFKIMSFFISHVTVEYYFVSYSHIP